jgi:hypothetical protein
MVQVHHDEGVANRIDPESCAVRAEELIADRPELVAAVRPLLEARTAIERQIGKLDVRS